MSGQRYDVALSYAGEDRDYVEAVANALLALGLRVFYDRFEEADLIGRNLIDHLSDVYQRRARLCVVFISAAYARKPFTRLERQAAQATALTADEPYLIPVRLDDTPLPGLSPHVAYISRRSPADVARLITAKLLLEERRVTSKGETPRDAVTVRFASLLTPDMDTFCRSLDSFRHWAPEKFGTIPVAVEFAREVTSAIETIQNFKATLGWSDRRITEETREHVSVFYDRGISEFRAETSRGIQSILHAYRNEEERLTFVARRYLTARSLVLAREILQYRLVTMPPFDWEDQLAAFGLEWGDNIMLGLPFVCYLENAERFLWVDADGYYSAPNVLWSPRYRIYVPAEFVITERDHLVSAIDFDTFFAPQFAEIQARGSEGIPLREFAQEPAALHLTIRGEFGYSTHRFARVDISRKDVADIVPRLVARALGLEQPRPFDRRTWMNATTVRRLLSKPEYFDDVFPISRNAI